MGNQSNAGKDVEFDSEGAEAAYNMWSTKGGVQGAEVGLKTRKDGIKVGKGKKMSERDAELSRRRNRVDKIEALFNQIIRGLKIRGRVHGWDQDRINTEVAKFHEDVLKLILKYWDEQEAAGMKGAPKQLKERIKI